METAMITQAVQKITEVLVEETWTVDLRNSAPATSETAQMPSGVLPPSWGTSAYGLLSTATT